MGICDAGEDLESGALFSYVSCAARLSQRIRKRIEESFGWIKATAGLAKTRHRGVDRVGWMFTLTVAACNLVRIPKLLAEPAP